jgi:hypothetical protein
LIPKKGDLSKIKNWRPISLLNCLYKIISKAINERLKLVSNRILSRAQKGFTKGRYIQECLINITETIARCNKYEISAFILALDQEKAFDSVRHDFMRKCFEFFGFPENFIPIIEVFTTNRTTHIILDGGASTENFNLEIGNTQGNGPLPLQFNICEQILFFKIELEPDIRSVFEPREGLPALLHRSLVPVFDERIRNVYHYEKNKCSDKLEGFADDGTVMAKATPEAFTTIRRILDDFKECSGLRCNIDKSAVLPVGFGNNVLPDYFQNTGFTVVDNVTILGTCVTNNSNDLTNNFDKVIRKIAAIRNFWGRFRLSLPGFWWQKHSCSRK